MNILPSKVVLLRCRIGFREALISAVCAGLRRFGAWGKLVQAFDFF